MREYCSTDLPIFTDTSLEGLPTNERYEVILGRLVEVNENGVTSFRGGPMDLSTFGISQSWIKPVFVEDETGAAIFHLIHLNCIPGKDHKENQNIRINLIQASDLDLKLGTENSPTLQEWQQFMRESTETPKIILRLSTNGNIFFPHVSEARSLMTPDMLQRKIQKMATTLGLTIEDISQTRFWNFIDNEFIPQKELGDFTISEPRLVDHGEGQILVYRVDAPNSPWKYFEIFSRDSLDEIDRTTPVSVRVDSGCDSGECYHDQACDCRFQLHAALQVVQQEGGLIIHCPTQDGRGFGIVPKLATESLKHGLNPFNGEPVQPVDTVTAAKTLLGDDYDARTYEDIGRLLGVLGLLRIDLITDSKLKLDSLAKAGLEVRRRATGTMNGTHQAHHHVTAKHEDGERYFAE